MMSICVSKVWFTSFVRVLIEELTAFTYAKDNRSYE